MISTNWYLTPFLLQSVKILAGGFAFAGAEYLPLEFGADGYAADPAAAVQIARQLVFGNGRTNAPVASDLDAC